MRIITEVRSPNVEAGVEVDVRLLLLHYTATSLERTLEIFLGTSPRVGAHVVIAEDGTAYEIVPCFGGKALKTFHAGRSFIDLCEDGKIERVEELNGSAIGIELVNRNGNIHPFTEAQYRSLKEVIGQLQSTYPALRDPSRIVGHEDVAGWRGKVDPGWQFDWPRVFEDAFGEASFPPRAHALPRELVGPLADLDRHLMDDPAAPEALSLLLEKMVGWFSTPSLRNGERFARTGLGSSIDEEVPEDLVPFYADLARFVRQEKDAEDSLASFLRATSEWLRGAKPRE